MTLPDCSVIVKQVPLGANARQAADFLSQLEDSMAGVVRPCIVLDCARVRRVDNIFRHLLLRSLEEALKRNGDVRLAGVPDAARPALEWLGIERLFQVFSSTAEAAESFRRPAAIPTTATPGQDGGSQPLARVA